MDEELLADFDTFTTPQETPIMETQPMEEPMAVEPTVETPIVAEPTMEAPAIVAPEADQMLSDFDTFTQPQVEQVDPIEKHRPQNVDDNTWMDIKERVSKFLGEYTPVAVIPKMAAEFMGEAQQKEGSQVAEARRLKGLEENYQFAFSNLKDTYNAAVSGDKEAKQRLQEQQDIVNENIVSTLAEDGIEAYYDDGELFTVVKDKDGNEELVNLDEDTLANIASGFSASGGEIAGGIGGAAKGAVAGSRMGGLDPRRKAIGGIVGAGIGGYAGATLGSMFDLTRSAIALNKDIDAMDILEKSTARGVADVTGTAVIGLAAKGVSKTLAPLGKLFDRAKTLMKQGKIQGAKKQVMEDYGLSDSDIDKLYENVAKDVDPENTLFGDDLLRAKLVAAVQQQEQGLAPIRAAVAESTKAAVETSKEISNRAKEVMSAASKFSKKPSAIRKSVEAYEKVVGKNYGQVKGMIDEALPNYKPDLDTASFSNTLTNLNKRVVDQDVRLKVENLSEVLGSQKNETVGDLIETRQLFNKFYGKNISHFENKADKEALFSIQKTIDSKIDEAIETLPKDIGKQLNAAFKNAKFKYTEMFKTQDTATYNAIFKKGSKSAQAMSEEDIGKALVKYSRAASGDLEAVLSKLSPVQRTKSEFSILKQMIDAATPKGEAKAIDFIKLAKDIGTSKAIFKTPEAKQFLKNIEGYEAKFGKDVALQKTALGVSEGLEKNIGTSAEGKVRIAIASKYFAAAQRLFPGETGRRLSLQKSIEMALEKSRTPREFFFEASKIKGMPNKERISLKKAVKEIGEKEELLKKQMVDQQEKNRKAVADAQIKKQEMESKKVLSEQEFKKAKWEKAKEASKKQKLSEQAQKVKDASEVPIGGSEDMAKKEVKNVFAKDLSDEAKYKGMSKGDIKELERMEADEANKIFAKFGDNLAAGTIAGVEEDEKGNISFSPEKFVAGLGGYTALKTIAKSPTVRKELKGYFERMFDDLESNQKFNMLVGKQSIVSDRLTKVTKKHFPEIDIKDLDKDDILYFNKASRMLDNMDIQARKDTVLTQAEKQAIMDAPDRPMEQIIHDLFYDVAEIEGKIGEVSKLTDKPKAKIITEDAKNLLVQHNLTEENIKHSKEMGGLAVPSLAVTKVDTPLTGFGEITLLGHSDLIKPTRDIRVFGADVYSPRYPQINYNLTAKQQRVIDEDLAPYEEVTASREYAEKDSLNALYDNAAFRAKFLDEKGVKVKLPKTPKANADSMRAYKKYYKKLVNIENHFFEHDLARDADFQKAYIQELKDTDPATLLALEVGEPKGAEASAELIRLADRRALKLSSLGKQSKKAGKPDEYEIKSVIREAINKKKLGGELKSYAKDYLKDVGAKETIWNGTDRMGRNKYIEHTLSNVISKLKKDIRGGESFNYGIGTARAKLTPEFKTIKQIQLQKDKLVSDAEFELVKKEMEEKVDAVSDSLKRYYEYDSDSFGYQTEVLNAISEQDLKGYGFKNLPDDVVQEVQELTTALREMPTEYFEVKVLKELDIGEFKLAVVPNGTSKETIQILKDKGLKVHKYNPSIKEARESTIKKSARREKILFMHPATVGGAISIGVANEVSKKKESN